MRTTRLIPCLAAGCATPRRHTPHVAVIVLLPVIVALVLAGDIGQLAAATVLLLLAVFTVVNVALLGDSREQTDGVDGRTSACGGPARSALPL